MHPSTIEVLTVDKDGIQRTYIVPEDDRLLALVGNPSRPPIRSSRAICGVAEAYTAHREFATRYAIRQLKIPAEFLPGRGGNGLSRPQGDPAASATLARDPAEAADPPRSSVRIDFPRWRR